MGAAYTALANDAYATTWNPAGLGFLEFTQLAGQHLEYLEGIHYEHLGFVHPVDGQPVAFTTPPPPAFAAAVERLRSRREPSPRGTPP